jgi:hypothetical protein
LLANRKNKIFLKNAKPLLTKETARIALSKTYWQNDKILKALPGFSFMTLESSYHKSLQKLRRCRKQYATKTITALSLLGNCLFYEKNIPVYPFVLLFCFWI